jgi:hypothetical protein
MGLGFWNSISKIMIILHIFIIVYNNVIIDIIDKPNLNQPLRGGGGGGKFLFIGGCIPVL